MPEETPISEANSVSNTKGGTIIQLLKANTEKTMAKYRQEHYYSL